MNKSKKIYISIAIFALISITLIVFVVFPICESINKDAENFVLYKVKYASLEEQIKNLAQFKDLYQSYSPSLDKIDSLLVDSEVPIDFLHFLESTARDSQLSIKIFSSVSKEVGEDSWPILKLQVSTTGPAPNTLKFLEKLENNLYLIKIDNLNIKKFTQKDLESKDLESLTSKDIQVTFLLKVIAR